MPGWSFIDYDVGKLNCPLCATKITPQFRKTAITPQYPIKWMVDNYMRHFTEKHPDLKGNFKLTSEFKCTNTIPKEF